MCATEQCIATTLGMGCGWKILRPHIDEEGGNLNPYWCHDEFDLGGNLPDYFNDLNETHKVESKLINFTNVLNYHCELREIVARDMNRTVASTPLTCCIGATAAQRAEAIYKTLNWMQDQS
jgi:hypothetical protein